jgi:hypothetical protein
MIYTITIREYATVYVYETNKYRYRIRHFPTDNSYVADFIDYKNRNNDWTGEFTTLFLADLILRRHYNTYGD